MSKHSRLLFSGSCVVIFTHVEYGVQTTFVLVCFVVAQERCCCNPYTHQYCLQQTNALWTVVTPRSEILLRQVQKEKCSISFSMQMCKSSGIQTPVTILSLPLRMSKVTPNIGEQTDSRILLFHYKHYYPLLNSCIPKTTPEQSPSLLVRLLTIYRVHSSRWKDENPLMGARRKAEKSNVFYFHYGRFENEIKGCSSTLRIINQIRAVNCNNRGSSDTPFPLPGFAGERVQLPTGPPEIRKPNTTSIPAVIESQTEAFGVVKSGKDKNVHDPIGNYYHQRGTEYYVRRSEVPPVGSSGDEIGDFAKFVLNKKFLVKSKQKQNHVNNGGGRAHDSEISASVKENVVTSKPRPCDNTTSGNRVLNNPEGSAFHPKTIDPVVAHLTEPAVPFLFSPAAAILKCQNSTNKKVTPPPVNTQVLASDLILNSTNDTRINVQNSVVSEETWIEFSTPQIEINEAALQELEIIKQSPNINTNNIERPKFIFARPRSVMVKEKEKTPAFPPSTLDRKEVYALIQTPPQVGNNDKEVHQCEDQSLKALTTASTNHSMVLNGSRQDQDKGHSIIVNAQRLSSKDKAQYTRAPGLLKISYGQGSNTKKRKSKQNDQHMMCSTTKNKKCDLSTVLTQQFMEELEATLVISAKTSPNTYDRTTPNAKGLSSPQ